MPNRRDHTFAENQAAFEYLGDGGSWSGGASPIVTVTKSRADERCPMTRAAGNHVHHDEHQAWGTGLTPYTVGN